MLRKSVWGLGGVSGLALVVVVEDDVDCVRVGWVDGGREKSREELAAPAVVLDLLGELGRGAS